MKTIGIITAAIIIAFAITACDQPTGSDTPGNETPGNNKPTGGKDPGLIAAAAITHIHAPTFGAHPNSTADCATENVKVSAVTWSPSVADTFAANTAYTATVTLTAAEGYVFSKTLSATINGHKATVTNNNGAKAALSYTFPETLDKFVSNIAVYTQPKLTYTHGDAPDLTGLVVTMSYDIGPSDNVAFADFGQYGITTIPEYDDPLSVVAHHGEPIAVYCGELTAYTDNLTVNKADPAVTWPTTAAIGYGAALSEITLHGGTGAGTFAWTDGTIIPPFGSSEHEVTFTPYDTDNYNTLLHNVSVHVNNKANPVVTWPTAAPITYGAALSASTLSGGVGAGAFAWSNPSTIPTVSNNGYEVTFTPTDADNYNTLTHIVSITVNKANPTVTWPTAAAISYGAALSSSTLSGGVGAGTFRWTDGTIISSSVGSHEFEVTFTPTDAANFNMLRQNVSITVHKANPVVTWPTAAAITYGAALSASTFSGGTGAGTFKWTDGTVTPPVGNSQYEVTFTPTYTANYNTLRQTVSVIVTKATGAAVGVPVVATVTANSISITVAAPDNGQTVEYAIHTVNNAASSDLTWVSTGIFSNLAMFMTYYVYARSAVNPNYEAGMSSVSKEVRTVVTSTAEWNTALSQLNGKTGSYILPISGVIGITGVTTNSFGTTATGTLTVTLRGSGKLYLTGQGNILRIGARQTLIIDSEELTLEGLQKGQNGETQNNNASAVYVDINGSLELRNGIITGNCSGAGVSVNEGSFIMSGGIISNNTASRGGGVFMLNTTGGSFTMNGGKIFGNTADFDYGGGVCVYAGSFIMSGGEILGNTAEISGGGVYMRYGNNGGSFTMSGGKISDNTAIGASVGTGIGGGGVFVYGGIFTMINGEISGNKVGRLREFPTDRGGGVMVVYDLSGRGGILRIVTGTIYGSNEAEDKKNAAGIGSALLLNSSSAERGTFNASNQWVRSGDLGTTDNTIRVENGELVQP
ncbi:MAG: hypothetical protein LBH44_03140 [Treponema sp.]|jgi:hypothetical protein|nr:hypothetical protein [Treponema sp.]